MTDTPVIREIEPARVAGGLGINLLEGARFAVDDDEEIVAYALVALHKDGRTTCAGNVAFPDDCPFLNRYLFVAMCQERIREHLITDETARHIVNRANGFED